MVLNRRLLAFFEHTSENETGDVFKRTNGSSTDPSSIESHLNVLGPHTSILAMSAPTSNEE